MTKSNTLAGFRDLLPKDAQKKEQAAYIFASILKSFGFLPIQTPILEYAENLYALESAANSESTKQIYHFLDQGGREVGLRFDHTIPLARYITNNYAELTFPFKRYVQGEVFRGENPQKGRYRQFTQWDFDILGSKSLLADVEIIQIIATVLQKIGITDFIIKINNRLLLDEIIKQFADLKNKQNILQITDKLAKIGIEKVKDILLAEKLLDLANVDKYLGLISEKFNTASELKQFLVVNLSNSSELTTIIEQFIILDKLLLNDSIVNGKISFDLSIARGLDYYTGFVFETLLTTNLTLGAICSGGRFDNLTAQFGSKQICGVGASFGIDRLLNEFNINYDKQCNLLVACIDSSVINEAHNFVQKIKELGIAVNLLADIFKIKKIFDYAEKLNYHYLLIIGQDQIAGKDFILSDLKTGAKINFLQIEQLLKLIS